MGQHSTNFLMLYDWGIALNAATFGPRKNTGDPVRIRKRYCHIPGRFAAGPRRMRRTGFA